MALHKETLAEMWLSGAPREEIAERLGVTTVTVTRWARAAGLPGRRPGRRPGPEVRRVELAVPVSVHEEIVAALADGETVQGLLLAAARREVRRRATVRPGRN